MTQKEQQFFNKMLEESKKQTANKQFDVAKGMYIVLEHFLEHFKTV